MTSLVDLLKSKPGVQGGVGRRAVSAALDKGYTKDQIEAAGNTIKAEAAAGTYTGQTSGFDEAFSRIGEKDSSYFGDVDPEAFRDESGDIDVDAYHAQQDKHAGGADTASMRIGGQSWTEIENYMSGTGVTNPNHPSSSAQGASAYSKMLDRIGVGADLEAEQAKNTKQAGQISTLTGNYNGDLFTFLDFGHHLGPGPWYKSSIYSSHPSSLNCFFINSSKVISGPSSPAFFAFCKVIALSILSTSKSKASCISFFSDAVAFFPLLSFSNKLFKRLFPPLATLPIAIGAPLPVAISNNISSSIPKLCIFASYCS